MEIIEKLSKTTLKSHPLTHSRLKHLSSVAGSSEDHISRLAMALSISKGEVEPDWTPIHFALDIESEMSSSPKHLRGSTLLKDETAIWMALVLSYQSPSGYNEWRRVLKSHWERGVQILAEKNDSHDNWIRTLNSCIPHGE